MTIIYSALLLASWLIPIHILPWVGWQQEVICFGLVMLMGWHSLLILKAKHPVLLPQACWPPIVLIGLVAVQWANAQITFGGDAVVIVFYMFICVVCLAVGFAVGRGATATALTQLLALILVVGAVASTFIALVQAFDVWEDLAIINRMSSLRRPGANFGQPNHLATFLLMGIASLAYLFESGRMRAWMAWPAFFFLLLGVAMTESRTGLVSFFAMSLWWFARRRTIKFKACSGTVLAGAVCLLLLFWYWPTVLISMQPEGWFDGDTGPVNSKAGLRLIVWPQLFDAALQHPWFGWGLREVSRAHNSILDSYPLGESFSYSHNIALDLAVGIGLPLAALFISAMGIWLWRRMTSTKSLLPWYCLAVSIPLGVHSMLEFPFAYAYLLVPVIFLIGILEGQMAPQKFVRIPWWPATVLQLAMTAAMAISVVEYIAIEEDFRIARFESIHIGNTPSGYERPKIRVLSQLDALLSDVRLVPAPAMPADRIELARKVAMRYPWTATQNRYALSLALNGNTEEAVRQLKVMKAMHSPDAYRRVKEYWSTLADTQYPQLKTFRIP